MVSVSESFVYAYSSPSPPSVCGEDLENRKCQTCNIQMLFNSFDYAYICHNCGIMQDITEFEEDMEDCVDIPKSTAAMPGFRVVGGKGETAKLYNDCIQICRLSSSNVIQKRHIQKLMVMRNKLRPEDEQLGGDVIDCAAEMCGKLANRGKLTRKNQTEAMAACLYHACQKSGIAMKPASILEFFNISSTELVRGKKLTIEQYFDGVIDIPTGENYIGDYIIHYFEKLKIDTKYISFIIDLIKVTQNYNTGYRPSTRCAGAICVLNACAGIGISIEQLCKVCETSKTTFHSFQKFVAKVALDKEVFAVFMKHDILPPKGTIDALKKMKKL